VQHAEETNLCTEVSGIASDFEKSFRAGTKQEIVETWTFTEKRQRMTVTTYQDHVRPTMIPTEGRGKVYLRFENLPKAAGGPTLGPYPYVILSYESVRVGPDKVEVARWHRGFWNLSKDNSRWTDVTIFSSKDNNG
jgi:hypothetical protein